MARRAQPKVIERSIILDFPSNQGSPSSDRHNNDENWDLIFSDCDDDAHQWEDDDTGDVHREVLPHPRRDESFRGQSARVEGDPGAECVRGKEDNRASPGVSLCTATRVHSDAPMSAGVPGPEKKEVSSLQLELSSAAEYPSTDLPYHNTHIKRSLEILMF